jgi:hypothetical protein
MKGSSLLDLPEDAEARPEVNDPAYCAIKADKVLISSL